MKTLCFLLLIAWMFSGTIPANATAMHFTDQRCCPIRDYALVEIDHGLMLTVTGAMVGNPTSATVSDSTAVHVTTTTPVQLVCPKTTPLRGFEGYTINAATTLLLNGNPPGTWANPDYWSLNVNPVYGGYACDCRMPQITLEASVSMRDITYAVPAGTYTGAVTLLVEPQQCGRDDD